MDVKNTTNLGSVKLLMLKGEKGEKGEKGDAGTDYPALTNKPQINGVTLQGNLTAAQLGITTGDHEHDASDITSGTLAVARIPSLPASQIGSGTFETARIPDLSASKITSGTFGTARIPSLDASKITSGTFETGRIPSLAASKITSGTFSADRIPSLSASKITSGTFDAARIPALNYAASSHTHYGSSDIIAYSMSGDRLKKTEYGIGSYSGDTVSILGYDSRYGQSRIVKWGNLVMVYLVLKYTTTTSGNVGNAGFFAANGTSADFYGLMQMPATAITSLGYRAWLNGDVITVSPDNWQNQLSGTDAVAFTYMAAYAT